MFITQEAQYKNLRYLLAVHETCSEPGKRYPTLLYLHGAGSRGEDLNVIRGSSFFRNAFEQDIALRIIAPQCFADTWFDLFEQLIDFAQNVASDPAVDPERYYLSGVSMGGYAAWQLAMSLPDLFAAVTPVCGGGMYWNAQRLKNTPIWAFHGKIDSTVLVSESIHMVEAVNANGGHAKLTIYPDAGHNAWDPTFSDPAYWIWLLRQTKGMQAAGKAVHSHGV